MSIKQSALIHTEHFHPCHFLFFLLYAVVYTYIYNSQKKHTEEPMYFREFIAHKQPLCTVDMKAPGHPSCIAGWLRAAMITNNSPLCCIKPLGFEHDPKVVKYIADLSTE